MLVGLLGQVAWDGDGQLPDVSNCGDPGGWLAPGGLRVSAG